MLNINLLVPEISAFMRAYGHG